MKTFIYEIGVIDKQGLKHLVSLKNGLNVITGKSSTGKSALIEIFDYCFGSTENTIPKGVITNSAAIYYVAFSVNSQDMVVARNPELSKKAFFRRIDYFNSSNIDGNYFGDSYFYPLSDFKKYLSGFFVDIDDTDISLEAKKNRGKKAPTPSVRSFMSFILQHQNLVANKHALFYRFDEKEKRDQAIDHTKIFLGLVGQKYFDLSQERERLTTDIKKLNRQKDINKRASDSYKQRVEPVLSSLYALMGFDDDPLPLQRVLCAPQDAKDQLDKIILSKNINHTSDAITQRYEQLKKGRTQKIIELRGLQRQVGSIKKHLKEEELFVDSVRRLSIPKQVSISTLVCPFCHTKKENLRESAEKLQQAIYKMSGNLAQARPMKAKFQSSLVDLERQIEERRREAIDLNEQILEMEQAERRLADQNNLYEGILMKKAELFVLLDSIGIGSDLVLESEIKKLGKNLKNIERELAQYDVQEELKSAAFKVNKYMAEIGVNFEFEASYKPIKLNFSFESFDLYHLTSKNKKIYLRSMGSGANWLYSHITLFLALHKYFAELGNKCAIPSIIFFDQPTQVYFPNFNRDNSRSFEEQTKKEAEQRKVLDLKESIDDDIRAVENLFSQLSMYCNRLQKEVGFSPQIIVTDHADNLTLADGVSFDSLVNGNRWRTRGFIEPITTAL